VNLDPLLLSRIQFAFTVSFHIIFPSITIGLSIWLALLEGLHLSKGTPLFQRLFGFWLKVFAILFVMGVVTGIVMAFQFGTNWSVMSSEAGSVMGPLLGYETFTAFMLEATFLGVVLYGRNRVAPWFYFFSCCMLALGAVLSSFWILCNNSWMQVPVGYEIIDGRIVPTDWKAIVLGPTFIARWLHMLLASFLTTTMCIISAGSFYLLRGVHHEEARFMIKWGLAVTAILIVTQIIIGDINGKHMYTYQPAKFAAVEARWHPEHPGRQLWFAIPDETNERNLFEITTPNLGSWFATGSWTAPVSGLSDFPKQDWPPILIVFFAFRAMVGIGLFMLGISLLGIFLLMRGRLETSRWFLWASCLAFPTGFLAVLLGWFTTEIGRQPWVVYGLLRTAETLTPTLTGASVLATLIGYVIVYSVIFFPGAFFISRLLIEGPSGPGSHAALEAGIPQAKE
jgi:cytochrome bd ubiquinol oxidase subunit I